MSPVSSIITRMDPIRSIAEAVLGWIREAAVNLAGRFTEDVLGERIKRRRKGKRPKGRGRRRRSTDSHSLSTE